MLVTPISVRPHIARISLAVSYVKFQFLRTSISKIVISLDKCKLFTNSAEDDKLAMLDAGQKALQEVGARNI